ncbi:MAG: hypothetical protein KatS3mg001_412 [Candidatus Pacearchaeota archaeon]|nr:MAG: hypothetical protein KatS3mg001_412 [Candidatus Pacearchaeota archaeon]
MLTKKGDFIEIDFTGMTKEGEIFDSTLAENLKKISHNHEVKAEPFVFCLGEGMILKALDDFLINKEIGRTYHLEIPPEEAFGKRNPKLIQKIPLRIFKERNINPLPGVFFNFDGVVGKVVAVTSGMVIVDFNHYLSGKKIQYEIKILRKVDDLGEKIKALNKFFLKKEIPFEISGEKIILKPEKEFERLLEIFKEKYKEILNKEIDIKSEKS